MSGKSPVDSLWFWALGGALLVLPSGAVFLDLMETFGIAIGSVTALANIFMLKKMAAKAVAHGIPGKALIFNIFLKSSIRFLLTAVFLAILFYFEWLKPLGFMIGFTAVVLAVFAWGCGRIIFGGHNPL